MSDERVLPQNLEAERAVLGALMLHPEIWPEVSDVLVGGDFYRRAHQQIWDAAVALNAEGLAVDGLTLADYLARHGQLDEVGGWGYLSPLTDGVPRATNVAHYARVVKDASTRRQVIHAANQILADCFGQADPNCEVLDRAQQKLLAISTRAVESQWADGPSLARTLMADLEERAAHQAAHGLPTGFPDLDRVTGGLKPDNLVILAARPSVGKTALVLNIATHLALRQQRVVAVFSIEQSKTELRDRVVASVGHLDHEAVVKGQLRDEDWAIVADVCCQLDQGGLHIDDNRDQTSATIRAKARQLHARSPLSGVVVDYLQLVEEPGRWERNDLKVGHVAKQLRRLSHELHVPVVALSQLSRKPEAREDKRPMLSDLRESGALEQTADAVWLMYREEVYRRTPDNEGITEVNVAKNRNGATGPVKLRYTAHQVRFDSLAEHWRA